MSILSGLIVGIVPALQASMHVVNDALKGSGFIDIVQGYVAGVAGHTSCAYTDSVFGYSNRIGRAGGASVCGDESTHACLGC